MCAVHRRMMHTWRGQGFDCLLTLISIKIEHPQPLKMHCAPLCVSYMIQTGARVHLRDFKPWRAHLGFTQGQLYFKLR